MSLSADELIDRIKMKSDINMWRTLTVVFAVLFAIGLMHRVVNETGFIKDNSYIARVDISGFIMESRARDRKLQALRDSDNVKAVIVHINSPGGTIVGGEHIYNSLRKVAEKKPVVAVLGTLAASGGYMAAIAADKIYTSAGTMTGSIGVMVQTAEATELIDKLGINVQTFKSGPLKGVPSPVEKITPKVSRVMEEGIDDGYKYFTGLIIDRRPLEKEEVYKLADGRIYTGRQAVENKLVDAIGDEEDAVKWLEEEKDIKKDLPVHSYSIKPRKTPFQQLLTGALGDEGPYLSQIFSGSMMALWKP